MTTSEGAGDPHPPAWRELIQDAQDGGITLVLGAGVSMPRGIPSWLHLVRWACREAGITSKGIDWLNDDKCQPPDSMMLRVALEEVDHRLRSKARRGKRSDLDGRRGFSELLTRGIYADCKAGATDSLSIVCDALRVDQARQSRRITRVITLNVDDLLETEVNRGCSPDAIVAWPIARAHHHPRRVRGANSRPPVPVYHIHGFLPRDGKRSAEDLLVFSDEQYWASMANPLSIANRVFTHALHDSHCVFVGLSMTDLNINRWLGLHAHDVAAAKTSDSSWENEGDAGPSHRSVLRSLRRHYWIRKPSANNTLFERHLLRRGVVGIPIRDWSTHFQLLMHAAFQVEK